MFENLTPSLKKRLPWLVRMPDFITGIVSTIIKKDDAYDGSWQKRGGIGAFMMTARKWDRIENTVKKHKYDVLEALENNTDDIRDDIDDLIAYLILIRCKSQLGMPTVGDTGRRVPRRAEEPGPGYVDQD